MDNGSKMGLNEMMMAAKEKLEITKEKSANQQEDIYADLRKQIGDEDDSVQAQKKEENIPDHYLYQNDQDIDVEEGAEAAYPGGPSMAQVNIWKKQYGKDGVYHVRVVARDFVFRTLNRLEYKTIVSYPNTDALQREEVICKTCVLYPPYGMEEMAVQEAGYPASLSQIIMESSGFSNTYDIEVL